MTVRLVSQPPPPEAISISDEDLLRACGRGDATSLGQLFDRLHHGVFRYLARLSGTDDRDLDDLVQTTFVEVFRSARRFSGTSSAKTWVLGVATNVVRHHVRAEMRRKRATEELAEVVGRARHGLDVLVDQRRQLMRLAQALAELPHDERVAYVLCVIEGVPGQRGGQARPRVIEAVTGRCC